MIIFIVNGQILKNLCLVTVVNFKVSDKDPHSFLADLPLKINTTTFHFIPLGFLYPSPLYLY